VSGDTSCTDHIVPCRMRWMLKRDCLVVSADDPNHPDCGDAGMHNFLQNTLCVC